MPPDELNEARDWIQSSVGARCELEVVHIRPWSAVYTARHLGGVAYFKSAPQTLRGEMTLTLTLMRAQVPYVATVIGVNAARGWLLTQQIDGAVLRASEGDQQPAVWEQMLRKYAELQRATCAEPADWIDAGARDGRLNHVPALFDELVAHDEMLRAGDEALNDDEVSRLRSARPHIVAACEFLSTSAAPIGLIHNDLHDGNVCRDDSGFTFFDWGDAFVGPVFADLLLITRVANARMNLTQAQRQQMRSAYLAQWGSNFDNDTLEQMAAHAARLAPIFHALTWVRIAQTPGAQQEARGVARWTRRLLQLLGAIPA